MDCRIKSGNDEYFGTAFPHIVMPGLDPGIHAAGPHIWDRHAISEADC